MNKVVVVTGHRRSGTSMMMRALHTGGLPALYDEKFSGVDSEPDSKGYAPNHPAGLFEVGYYNQLRPAFMRQLAMRDALYAVKITWDCLVYLPRGNWTIIFMERPSDEINASCARVDEYIRETGTEEQKNQRNTELICRSTALPFSCFRPYNDDDVTHVLGAMKERRDVELLRVKYHDVIREPLTVFTMLRYTPLGRERLPIDIDKAASVIDSNLYRVRK